MKTSEECNEIYAALSKFAGVVQAPGKDSKNSFIGNRYASLAEVLRVARPALSECGLSVIQELYSEGEYCVVATRVVHSSGQWVQCEPCRAKPVRAAGGQKRDVISADDATTHEKAAAWTYLRRYGELGALNLTAEEDTDGEPQRDGYDQRTGETQQSQRRELPAQRQEEQQRPATHRTGPEVEAAIVSLGEASTIEGLAILATAFADHHGPIASTRPWIAFQERCRALNIEPRAVINAAKAQEAAKPAGAPA
jgi:hypothetical protein